MTPAETRLAAALADRYRIERELGAGGMATVYLAADLKHDRRVAIKVLKPELAAVLGAERFVVEIKTTAALSHPHILPLFDSGTADGFLYYVMPYLQGETVREKLSRETQFGVEEAVRIAREVADALDYAHRHGVIHRDIKPENLLLHDGRAMVMDFGIALAVSAAAGGRMTETGLSLGTPHYMSPEQATADKDLSPRSDIYSIGCVLYEMLTGSPPHVGATAQQIIMKIIADDARPVTELRRSVPPNVSAAIATALEKLPADRFATARAFAEALQSPGYQRTTTHAAPRGARSPSWGSWIPLAAGAAAILLAALWVLTRPKPHETVSRYEVAGAELTGSPWSRLAVSPDGSRLVYVGPGERGTRLFVRSRDQLEGTPIPGTDGAVNPSLSPDGNRVAFMADVKIKVVSLAGGPSLVVTDSAVGFPGVGWGRDGFIYYDKLGIGPLMRVSEAGGAAESVGALDSLKGELQLSWPDPLPNGRGIIITVAHGGPGTMGTDADEIAILDLATGRHRSLLHGVIAKYAASGHLLYVTASGTLMAVPFDQARMALTGDPVALIEGVSLRQGGGAADLAVSDNGTLWYTAGKTGIYGSREVVWVRRDGAATPVAAGWQGLYETPALSPDGKRLAISTLATNNDIWVRDLEQGTMPRITSDGANNSRPAWRIDGRSLAFITSRVGLNGSRTSDVYERRADASAPATPLLHAGGPIEEIAFSRDGAWMLYRLLSAQGFGDLFARRVGSDSSIALLTTPADERVPALSPDGRWLAYTSSEAGRTEVYVSPFPATGSARWQISTRGGIEPVWAHSGRELFYRTLGMAQDSQMVMEVLPGKTFTPGKRRGLFPLTGYLTSQSHQFYDVAPDDQRFVMIRTPRVNQQDRLIVVEHFFEELRQKVHPK